VKLLPLIVSAVFVVVALVLTLAVANSADKQQTVTGAAVGGLHSAELMRLYEGNRRFDVNGLACNTPLGEFELRCTTSFDEQNKKSRPWGGPGPPGSV
jgi:hypothetical protein